MSSARFAASPWRAAAGELINAFLPTVGDPERREVANLAGLPPNPELELVVPRSAAGPALPVASGGVWEQGDQSSVGSVPGTGDSESGKNPTHDASKKR